VIDLLFKGGCWLHFRGGLVMDLWFLLPLCYFYIPNSFFIFVCWFPEVLHLYIEFEVMDINTTVHILVS